VQPSTHRGHRQAGVLFWAVRGRNASSFGSLAVAPGPAQDVRLRPFRVFSVFEAGDSALETFQGLLV